VVAGWGGAVGERRASGGAGRPRLAAGGGSGLGGRAGGGALFFADVDVVELGDVGQHGDDALAVVGWGGADAWVVAEPEDGELCEALQVRDLAYF
jgi:hypothetical protein